MIDYKMLEGKEAVIFDMDGTLIDSLHIWADIDVEFLSKYKIEKLAEYQGAISGMSFREVAEYTKQVYPVIDLTVDEVMAVWNQMAEAKYANEIQYKPGAEEFIKECKKRGLKCGIATSNSRFLVEKLFSRLHLDEYMSVILTGDDIVKGKPNPDIYLKVAEKLDVLPEKCIVFEDVVAGIMAGLSAGMEVCAVRDSHTLHVEDEKRDLATYFIEGYL